MANINFKSIAINLLKKLIYTFEEKTSFTRRYQFENRSKDSDTLCIVLAGYKEILWDTVFDRIKKFVSDDIDVCIVSSGLYSEKLNNIAKENNWSYISTKKNSVTLAQNMVLKLFPNAEYIYKLDEDIFVTKNFFETLKYTYDEVQYNGVYDVGFVAPLIPINGCGHVILLEKLGLTDFYEKNFEKVKFNANNDRMIVNNLDVAEFMWGKNNLVPHIDDLNNFLNNSSFSYSIAPVKFSIGAIFFHRNLWEDMHYFRVDVTKGMGADERQICTHCILESKSMIISENSCVGHLSFGMQNEGMKKFFIENPENFKIK